MESSWNLSETSKLVGRYSRSKLSSTSSTHTLERRKAFICPAPSSRQNSGVLRHSRAEEFQSPPRHLFCWHMQVLGHDQRMQSSVVNQPRAVTTQQTLFDVSSRWMHVLHRRVRRRVSESVWVSDGSLCAVTCNAVELADHWPVCSLSPRMNTSLDPGLPGPLANSPASPVPRPPPYPSR